MYLIKKCLPYPKVLFNPTYDLFYFKFLFTDCDPIPDPKIPDIHMHIYLPKDKGNVVGGSDYSICGEVDCDERRRKRSPGEEPEDLVDVQCCGNILAIRIWISIGIKIFLIIIVDSNILK